MIRKESYKKKTKWDRCHREREKEVLIPDADFYTKWQKKNKKKKTIALSSQLRHFVLFLTTNNVIRNAQ